MRRSLSLNLDDISGSAPRYHSADPRCGFTQWIVSKVSIPLRRLHLRVTKEGADQRERSSTTDQEARISVSQIMYSDAFQIGKLADLGPRRLDFRQMWVLRPGPRRKDILGIGAAILDFTEQLDRRR